MSRRTQCLAVVVCALLLTSAASHLLARAMNLRTNLMDRAQINAEAPGRPMLAIGSSLTFFGVSFREVSRSSGRPIITRSTGAASPCELEYLALEVPEAPRVILGVSVFDLNENNLSDARPLLVPFGRTFSDIRDSDVSWQYAKRVLWSYPGPWMQRVFPTAGRSTAAMVGIRDFGKKLLGRSGTAAASEDEPKLSFKTDDDSSGHTEKLSDWDDGRIKRNLSQLAGSGLAGGRFDGPKSLALQRILTAPNRTEAAVLLIFPVSPPYREKFVNAAAAADFEAAIARAQAAAPQTAIVRLDRDPELQSSAVFWDLVHLNDAGRKIATRRVIEALAARP